MISPLRELEHSLRYWCNEWMIVSLPPVHYHSICKWHRIMISACVLVVPGHEDLLSSGGGWVLGSHYWSCRFSGSSPQGSTSDQKRKEPRKRERPNGRKRYGWSNTNGDAVWVTVNSQSFRGVGSECWKDRPATNVPYRSQVCIRLPSFFVGWLTPVIFGTFEWWKLAPSLAWYRIVWLTMHHFHSIVSTLPSPIIIIASTHTTAIKKGNPSLFGRFLCKGSSKVQSHKPQSDGTIVRAVWLWHATSHFYKNGYD